MSEPYSRRLRPIALTALLGLAIAVAVWFFKEPSAPTVSLSQAAENPKGVANAPRPALSITAEMPQRRSLAEQLTANGNIAAWQEASVGADATGLRLAEVRVEVGDRVQKGQVLATFDTELVQADQAQARASLAEAEAALTEAAGNADRARTVASSGALTQQQINQYLTAEKTARARVAAARALLDTQDLRLKHTRVLAPDAGVISAREATVGAVVGAGMELFRLVRRGRLEWRAEVTAEDLGRLKSGLRARVTLPDGSEAQGTLRQLAPTLDPKTRYAIAYVDLSEDSSARSGMFARGSFDLGRNEALTVPQEAIVMRDGFAYVLIVGPDQRVSLKRVQTGRVVDNHIEIKEGLLPDQTVAVRGAAFLNDGDLVRISAENSTTKSTGAPSIAQ